MQKGTKGVHYKPMAELRTKTLNIRVTAAQLDQIKATATDEGLSTSAWVVKTLMESARTPQAVQTGTSDPGQARPSQSQTSQETAEKPCPSQAKAKTTRRRKTAASADADEKPAPKSSRTTTRRKATTRRASTGTGRRKVVAKEDRAA